MTPLEQTAGQIWSDNWTVGVRIWIDRQGKTLLGEGRADLLEAIGAHRSITKAAKALGMSYRRAWNLVQEVNDAAGEPLVEAAVGGVQGGGAQLTDRGRYAVGVYRQLRGSLEQHAASALRSVVTPSADSTEAPCLHVAAAISLQEALGQILTAFALHRPLVRVRAVYGASNELAEHLLAGAPGDLFISAEASEVDQLERAGRVAFDSRRVVARNGFSVVGSLGSQPLKRVDDLLDPTIRRVALADPACPLGRYSKALLARRNLYERLRPKTIFVDNSRAVLAAVASGVADVGVAFDSDASRAPDCVNLIGFPRNRASADYVAAVLNKSPLPDEATALVDFFGSKEALRALRRCGFRPAASK